MASSGSAEPKGGGKSESQIARGEYLVKAIGQVRRLPHSLQPPWAAS